MRYLLDTNAVVELLRDTESKLARRVRQERPDDLAISALVVHELYFGAFKSRRASENAGIVDALRFAVVDFDKEDARQAGAVRALLANQGQSIGPYDALIAGQALARDLTLITHNRREFGRVPELKIEDWQI